MLKIITPARVAAAVGYDLALLIPDMNPNIRGIIVGAISSLYVIGVTVIEHAKVKRGTVSAPHSSQVETVPAQTPTTTQGA